MDLSKFSSLVELAEHNEANLLHRMAQYPQFEFFGKRRKKKIRSGSSSSISVPKKPLTAYAIFVKKVSP